MDVEVNVFDQEEIHENCTVIIWRNSITGEERIEYVDSLLSDTLKKSWKSARRFIGKQVKPEKESKYKQMSDQYRAQLMQNLQK